MTRGLRLTRAGWLLLAGAVGMALGARILGLIELDVLAAAGALAVGAALARAAVTQPRLAIQRSVLPPRVHVGSAARVEVQVLATGLRPTPVITLVDPIGGQPGARLVLAPLGPGHSVRATYRLPTHQRGEISVGPLEVEVTDPLGLTRQARSATGPVRLLVLPHVDEVPALSRRAGSDPLAGQEGRLRSGGSGEEFHALRPYSVGDDLRRVHWPASARVDDLVVRQDEEPHQGRLTLVLDVAAHRSRSAQFERMVSATASIAAAHWHRGDIVRLVRSDGNDTGWITGQADFDHLLEVLALTERAPTAELASTLRSTPSTADTVVAVVGDLADAEVAALPGRRATPTGAAAGLTVVRFPTSLRGPHRPAATVAGVTIIEVAPGGDFVAAWSAARTVRRGTVKVGAPA